MITLNPRILGAREFKPAETRWSATYYEHWCNQCDSNVVTSEDDKSGSFFIFFGHTWEDRAGSYSGEYKGVMLAFCRACLDAKE